jgi:hypothetical protein
MNPDAPNTNYVANIPNPVTPPPKVSKAFRELAEQFGGKAAEDILHPTPNQNRHERRGQEAFARVHYFTLPGRKMRNVIRRKSTADQ